MNGSGADWVFTEPKLKRAGGRRGNEFGYW